MIIKTMCYRFLLALICLALISCAQIRSKVHTRIDSAVKQGKYVSAGKMIDTWLKFAPQDTVVLAMAIQLRSTSRQLDRAIDAYYRYYGAARFHSSELMQTILLAGFRVTNDRNLAQAIRVSGEFDLKCARGAIWNATFDRTPYIRSEAYTAIGKLKDSLATRQLVSGYMDDNPHVRTCAIIATSKHGDKASLALSKICALDPIDYNRWRTIVLRAELGDTSMLHYLLENVAVNFDILTIEAAASLVKIGHTEHLPVLEKGLKSNVAQIRWAATVSLCELKQNQYLSKILTLANDTCDKVREAVAQGLGIMEDTTNTAVLLKLIEDKDSDTRAAATISLTQVMAQKSEKILVQLLRDRFTEVRISALGSLISLINTIPPTQPDTAEMIDIDYP